MVDHGVEAATLDQAAALMAWALDRLVWPGLAGVAVRVAEGRVDVCHHVLGEVGDDELELASESTSELAATLDPSQPPFIDLGDEDVVSVAPGGPVELSEGWQWAHALRGVAEPADLPRDLDGVPARWACQRALVGRLTPGLRYLGLVPGERAQLRAVMDDGDPAARAALDDIASALGQVIGQRVAPSASTAHGTDEVEVHRATDEITLLAQVGVGYAD